METFSLLLAICVGPVNLPHAFLCLFGLLDYAVSFNHDLEALSSP